VLGRRVKSSGGGWGLKVRRERGGWCSWVRVSLGGESMHVFFQDASVFAGAGDVGDPDVEFFQ